MYIGRINLLPYGRGRDPLHTPFRSKRRFKKPVSGPAQWSVLVPVPWYPNPTQKSPQITHKESLKYPLLQIIRGGGGGEYKYHLYLGKA